VGVRLMYRQLANLWVVIIFERKNRVKYALLKACNIIKKNPLNLYNNDTDDMIIFCKKKKMLKRDNQL